MEVCECEKEKDETEEKKEKKINLILFFFGAACLLIAFILQKVGEKQGSEFSSISYARFSNPDFYHSFGFIVFFLYTIGYLPLLIKIGHERIEERKEGEILNENTLRLIATLGAYGINEYPEALFVILFSIIGERLEDYASDKSKKSIKKLVNNRPLYAHTIQEDGTIFDQDPSRLKIGDRIEVRPGEKISVDGKILRGVTSLDLSSINGESLPKDAKEGDRVYSGSINLDSVIVLEVEKEFKNSTLSKIRDLVENEQGKKAKSERFITKFAKYYTPAVILIALITFITGFGLSGFNWAEGGEKWLYEALSILLISCPCALVISVPITFFAGIGSGSKYGILFKGSVAIENRAKADTFVFDKTGTLTKGNFVLVNKPDENYLKIAASLEGKSTHPLAKAVSNAYQGELLEVENFKNIPGHGIEGTVDGTTYLIGNLDYLKQSNVQNIKQEDTPYKILYLGIKDGNYLASFIVKDEVKKEAKSARKELEENGRKKSIVLSGDDQKIVTASLEETGVKEGHGELLPEEKLGRVKELASNGKVCYVGDGINDSPSLLAANVGVSRGALGSDAAIEASDVVIRDDSLKKVSEAKHLSKKTRRVRIFGIILSIGLKVLRMILVLTGVRGRYARIVAGVSDTGVRIISVLNALRMLFYKPKYLKQRKEKQTHPMLSSAD